MQAAAAAAMEVGDDAKMQMDEDDSLQTSNVVFDYGDDEERVAMEKVHGLNDFDTDDPSKFSTLDDVNGFVGDDDWRAMASEAAAAVDESTLAAAAAAHQDGSSMQLSYDGDDQGQDEEFVECGSPGGGLQIMRFTRKRTPNQRGRRPPPPPLVKPIIGAALRESLQLEQEKLKTVTVTVKTEADASAFPVSLAPVKPNSHDEPQPKSLPQQQQAVRKVEPAERMLHRPKQPLRVSEEQQQQQNKKPKALAFQKSRNIINKRINADSSVKPEATPVDLNCSEVRETQGKNRAAAAELRALGEEIRPLLLAGEEGGEELNKRQQLPPAVHEKWLDLHCKQLRTRFDLHFSVARHFLCHSSAEHCSSSS